MAEQMGFDFTDGATGAPEKMTKEQYQKMERERYAEEDRQNAQRDKEKAQEKAKARGVENTEYADKRTPRSELIQKAEMAKIRAAENARDAAKATRAQSSMLSPQGNTTAAGRGELSGRGGVSSGGSGSMGTGKMNRDITKNYKKGGKVSSASSRGDGCAQRGKTKGRMI